MAGNNQADVTIHLTEAQNANLSAERRARLNEVIRNAFIAETQDLGPEFLVDADGPGVRNSTAAAVSQPAAAALSPKKKPSPRKASRKKPRKPK